jgi:hypothetical protein
MPSSSGPLSDSGWEPQPLPEPWIIAPATARSSLEAELRAEVADGHPLSGGIVTAIARCQACDDVQVFLGTQRGQELLVETCRVLPHYVREPPRPHRAFQITSLGHQLSQPPRRRRAVAISLRPHPQRAFQITSPGQQFPQPPSRVAVTGISPGLQLRDLLIQVRPTTT